MRRLRELGLLARAGDIEALRELLVDEAGALEGPLGVQGGQVRAIAVLPDAELVPAVTRMLHRGRQQTRQGRREALRDGALAGVDRLVCTAIWSGNSEVHLDPALLLGPVLADLTCRYLGFRLGDHHVPVERRRLLAVRRLAPTLPGLSASLDSDRLRFRWRDGRGGLDLRSPDPSWSEREHVLHIVLTPHGHVGLVATQAEPKLSRPSRPMSWFGETLTDLDLHI